MATLNKMLTFGFNTRPKIQQDLHLPISKISFEAIKNTSNRLNWCARRKERWYQCTYIVKIILPSINRESSFRNRF